MCACTETDVRESAKDCTLASGEGHDSRGETSLPICVASPCSHPLNALYNIVRNKLLLVELGTLWEELIAYFLLIPHGPHRTKTIMGRYTDTDSKVISQAL
jgi:hypothetical protein